MPITLDEEGWLGIIADPQEASGVEFKGGEPFSKLKNPIIKAALGLVNLQDGGFIVIGVDTVGRRLVRNGIMNAVFDTYVQDEVFEQVNRHASPGIRLAMEPREFEDKRYLVIQIFQFDNVPVFCKKTIEVDNKNYVQEAVMYCRTTTGKIETRPVTVDDLRTILNLAVRLAIQNLESMTTGICRYAPEPQPPSPTDAELFGRQRGEL